MRAHAAHLAQRPWRRRWQWMLRQAQRLLPAAIAPARTMRDETARIAAASHDMTDSDRVRDLFLRCERLLRRGAKTIIIDLRAVEHADTKLLACIVAVYQLARITKAHLEVMLSDAVRQIARICRLEWLMIHLSSSDADDADRATA